MKHIFCSLIFCVAANLLSAQNVFVNKPYVQIGNKVSASTLQVLWHAANEDAKWELQHRANPKAAWKNADSISYTLLAQINVVANRVNHASLSGLTAGRNTRIVLFQQYTP